MKVPDTHSSGLRARARWGGYGLLFLSSRIAEVMRVAWEIPVLIVARAAPKKCAGDFAEVLAKMDPLSAGLRANARSEGYGRLFLSSGLAVSARVSWDTPVLSVARAAPKKSAVCFCSSPGKNGPSECRIEDKRAFGRSRAAVFGEQIRCN